MNVAPLRAPLEALTPVVAGRAVEALGWLAPWWLRPEVIAIAALRQPAYGGYLWCPSLPLMPGGCWVMLVVGPQLPLLREAVVLPLCWRRGRGEDRHLPAALRQLSYEVRGEPPGDGWSLHAACPPGTEPVDLNVLNGEVDLSSGWASVMGGRILAEEGLSPRPDVWASAAFDGRYGIGRVAGIGAKVRLAEEWGATLYVPAQNLPDVPVTQVSVRPLVPRGGATPRELLGPYLEELGAEPAASDFGRARRFHATTSRVRAERFFWDRLRGEVARRCRADLPAECRPTHLVTVLGPERSVVALAPEVLPVRHCLMVVSPPLDERLRLSLASVREALSDRVTLELVELSGETVVDQQQAVRQAVARLEAGALAFDLTPGFKSLSLALEGAAPAGAWLVYCRHETDHKGQAVLGTQRYECWRKE